MDAPIIVVSGLPRSGTSMAMRMLEAGGVPILTDGSRPPDADNPHGYFELERVKRLQQDSTWLAEATGKAIKVVLPLLTALPANHRYQVILMRRNLTDLLVSQRRMLARRGGTSGAEDAQLMREFGDYLLSLERWIVLQPNIRFLNLDFESVIRDPQTAAIAIRTFLACPLNLPRMIAAVDLARPPGPIAANPS